MAGLPVLVDSLRREGQLTDYGRSLTSKILIRLLRNRLLIQQEVSQHPSLHEARIANPLFIMGLPRTGTTFLHNLFAQIPGFRALRQWEVTMPAPCPRPETESTDPRPAVMETVLKTMFEDVPEFSHVHPVRTLGPAECGWLFRNSFADWVSPTAWRVPSYTAWVETQDMLPHYRYYRRLLQLLSVYYPPAQLVLKDPFHLWYLPEIMKVFPDARVIFLRRDAVEATTSFCSLVAILHSRASAQVSLPEIGREWLSTLSRMVKRATLDRRVLAPQSFFDLSYDTLTADPLGAVRTALAHFGITLDRAQETTVATWLATPASRASGKHHYRPDQFGLSAGGIVEAFADTFYAS